MEKGLCICLLVAMETFEVFNDGDRFVDVNFLKA